MLCSLTMICMKALLPLKYRNDPLPVHAQSAYCAALELKALLPLKQEGPGVRLVSM